MLIDSLPTASRAECEVAGRWKGTAGGGEVSLEPPSPLDVYKKVLEILKDLKGKGTYFQIRWAYSCVYRWGEKNVHFFLG